MKQQNLTLLLSYHKKEILKPCAWRILSWRAHVRVISLIKVALYAGPNALAAILFLRQFVPLNDERRRPSEPATSLLPLWATVVGSRSTFTFLLQSRQ